MYEKVIVLEIKEKYALALKENGETIKIKIKKSMSAGDKIYIFPEDIYEEEKSNLIIFTNKNKEIHEVKKNMFRKLTVAAAAVLLCISMATVPMMKNPAYAMVSFDGEKSIQFKLDKNYNIVDVYSPDNSISKEQLKNLRKKNLSKIGNELKNNLGDGKILVGYSSDTEDKLLKEKLENMFNDNLVFISGNDDDVENAKEENISLGKYLAGITMSDDEIKIALDEMTVRELAESISDKSQIGNNPDYEDILEDYIEEYINQNYGVDIDVDVDDDLYDDDDDDEEDDDEDDEDDDEEDDEDDDDD